MLIQTETVENNQSGMDDFFIRHRGERVNIQPPRAKTLIQIPGSFFPHADFEDALWITMTAKQISNLNTQGRGGSIRLKSTGTRFKFLAPMEIVEVHNHSWEPYESFHSKMLEKIRGVHSGIEQWSTIGKNIFTETDSGGSIVKALQNGTILSELERVAANATNYDVPKYKIDSPMVYQSSNRRQWDWNFTLCDSDPAQVLAAIQQLQAYAAPSNVSELGIEFPYLFSLASEPEGLINCSFAAMTSIQPTFHGPFLNGAPSWVELTLSFQDMSPLFKETLETGGIVNVIDDTGKGKVEVDVEAIRKIDRGEILNNGN
jgi:hypothetical protein